MSESDSEKPAQEGEAKEPAAPEGQLPDKKPSQGRPAGSSGRSGADRSRKLKPLPSPRTKRKSARARRPKRAARRGRR